MTGKPHKRQLKLEELADIVDEANRLLDCGYQSSGKWGLAQTCFHLAEWTRYPMDGFPKPPLVMRMIFGAMKVTGVVGRIKNGILKNGFSAGTPTAPQTVIDPNAMNDRDGVEQLTKVIERMKQYDGILHTSPLFGVMDRDLWVKVTLLHAEHHLGFLHSK